MIDLSTEFGQRVQRRLTEERIIWLTTVSEGSTPQPRPVWFLWDGETFLIYSRPNTYKLRHIKHNAKRRGTKFNVSIEYLWKLFLDQKGKCFYTGRALKISKSIRNNNVNWSKITASVDRIDSNKGYVEGNLQWVHKDINRFKNNYSHDEFIKMCHEVVQGNPEPSLVNDK